MSSATPCLVGPVLQASNMTNAILAAIQSSNPSARFTDRGAYVRVQVPEICRLERDEIERISGKPFHLPGDLELVMSSFQGRITIGENEVIWRAPVEKKP